MASSYFTIPSFNRAKRNKEDLEKTNPQEPVLKDEDEKFFDKEMRSSSVSEAAKDAPPVKITDDGEAKPVSTDEQEQAVVDEDHAVIPENRPDSGYDGASYDDKRKEEAAAAGKERKEKKNKGMKLPSQEDAEAATRGFEKQGDEAAQGADQAQSGKKTWASYLPSMRSKRPQSSGETPPTSSGGEGESEKKDTADATDKDPSETKPTWTQYATSYVPSLPKLTKSSDADNTPIYNEDGSINEKATAEKQEREVSVLLDNLNLSSINNRVFAFSDETQRLYQRFLLCLKDVMNGAPTAYEDMDKLMKEAGPRLEEQWKSMPPFVQTLVKSLPMRLGPEVLAVASEKPDDELKRKMQDASSGGGGEGVAAAAMNEGSEEKEGEQGKKKRKIPGLKALTGQQGAIATILRNTVTFIQTRFPFLASGTNVVMSLAVFILMFVFWYCHKRGKEVRLAKEAEGEEVEGSSGDSDDSEVEEMVEELEKADEESPRGQDEKAAVLEQPAPAEVPLPEAKAEESDKKKDVATT